VFTDENDQLFKFADVFCDGILFAYGWLVTLSANPDLNNETTAAVVGLANRLRDRLVQIVNG